jgi:hypothetical protein
MTQPQDEPKGVLETMHTFEDGPMPTGVSVSAAVLTTTVDDRRAAERWWA